jgi:hypothetical protein
MTTLTGVGRLIRFILRRDRVRLTVWIVAISGMTLASAGSLPSIYPDQAAVESYVALFGNNPALIAFAGPGYRFENPDLGLVLINETQLNGIIALALMSIFLVNRHTRAEEESERAELVRSNVVGRHAPARGRGRRRSEHRRRSGLCRGLYRFRLPDVRVARARGLHDFRRASVRRGRGGGRADHQQRPCDARSVLRGVGARLRDPSRGRRGGQRPVMALAHRLGTSRPGLRRRTVVGPGPLRPGGWGPWWWVPSGSRRAGTWARVSCRPARAGREHRSG